MHRRRFCAALAGVPATLVLPSLARAQTADSPIPELPADAASFDRGWLVDLARRVAGKPYHPNERPLPPSLSGLDWDQYQAISFDADHALWRDTDLLFQAQFFHLGLFFHDPVRLFEVVDGEARPIEYNAALFHYGATGFDPPLPDDLGFAGFRLHFHTNFDLDMVAFLGASYFRAVTGTYQYGLSARGLAVKTGLPEPEEFPIFRAFWLERPAPGQAFVRVHALLDGPSVAGAYSFVIEPGMATVMDVTATLFPRARIDRLGIAPLTSMYQTGENDRRQANDFRPEIHDSDGLSLWTGAGEWVWRPLVNPTTVRVNSFVDENPRGFGLMQRDRAFANYQDDGVFYERRPSLWVEPRGPWGRGAVQLVEIPTEDETFDNIVAFWNPERPAEPGDEINIAYRLHWCLEPPIEPPLATVRASRTGIGGVVGQPREYYSRKFVVDFAGGDLSMLPDDAAVEPVITVSRGMVELPSARPLHAIRGRRAIFDLRPTEDTREPIDMRLFLRLDGRPLTETWVYQWAPPAP